MVYLPQVFQFTPLREGRPAGIFDATRRPYFNSRPSARGDDGLHTLFERLPDFNSRPSARGDIAALVAFRHVEDFNSRPSARGDREFVHGAARVGISIHAPPRGATSQKNAKKGFTRFQFTPLREGRRAPVWYHIIRSNISIHAPPRGATCAILVSSAGSISIHAPPRGATRACWLAADGADISIHAPPRGATVWLDEEPLDWPFQFTPLREGRRQPGGKRRNTHDFNSRPSARGDTHASPVTNAFSAISIHAPPRGATHPRETFPASRLFQFTPLREGRRQRNHKVSERFNFNSRPSARGDAFPSPAGSPSAPISIHAPPRGATRYEVTDAASGEFQFTPLREGRPNAFSTLSVLVYFNSRPSARGDGASSSSTGGAALFQFTPLREGRPEMPDYWLRAPGYFNSRPSARGDPPHMPMAGKETYFNSRPSARGDLMARSKTKKISHFNSRPSARGDVRAASRGRGLCISIHAPPRGATGVSASRSSVSLRISIHAPPRGATARQNVGDCIRVFQFTPLREGRLSQKSITPVGDYFNSRPSARGDSGQRPPSLLNPHFNSRPSARGDARYLREDLSTFISIHAPPRGATIAWVNGGFSGLISIHAPPRGATSKVSGAVRQGIYFNSRPSARGDVLSCFVPAWTCLFQFTPLREGRRGPQGIGKSTLLISIHAPPRGATAPTPQLGGITIFQFTPLREGRRNGRTSPATFSGFQFTPLREGRQPDALMRPAFLIFQFTPLREGRPGQAEEQLQRWMISIHAPPRGATHKVILRGQNIVFISIHAPPRGATATAASTETPSRFQFTPLREGRRASGETSNGAENFNSRPSARGDGQQGYLGLHQGYFNSRPSARGDKSCPNRTATSSLFQFTPLREGRHPLHECNTEGIFISIHAPPRGATCEAAPQHRYLFLFQFTPLREGRRCRALLRGHLAYFNSRPSARGDNS